MSEPWGTWMPSDHEMAFAFLARRQASRAFSVARWSHLLSLELGWMNPGQARAFVDAAVRAGLLAPDGDVLRLVIDPQAVEVPRGFRPRPDAPAAPGPTSAGAGPPAGGDPFLAWLAKVAAQRGWTRDQVLQQVHALQDSMGGLLTAEAAVLVLARRAGLEVADAARAAEAAMVRPASPVSPARGAEGPGREGSP